MTRDGRLILFLTILVMYGLVAVESRYRGHEDDTLEARQHRHRHRHEAWTNSRNHHEATDRRKPSWSQDLEYEEEEEEEEYEDANDDDSKKYEDEYYEIEGTYHERPYLRNHRNGYHGRAFESRCPSRYHRAGYHYNDWHQEEAEKRRPARYNNRRYRSRVDRFNRNRHRGGHSRSRDSALGFREDSQEYEEEELERERMRNRHEEEVLADERYSSRRSSKRHRSNWRRDWKSRHENMGHRGGRRVSAVRGSDFDSARRFRLHDRRVKANLTESKTLLGDKKKEKHVEDYDEILKSLENKEKEKEEDDIWKELENGDNEEDEEEGEEDNEEGMDGNEDEEEENDKIEEEEEEVDEGEEEGEEEEEEDELDNDFYKNEKKAPLNTFDDIIRRFTSDDPVTARPTVKRDYRNVGNENYYPKKMNHGNLKYHQNISRVSRDHSQVLRPSYVSTGYLANKKYSDDTATKIASESTIERKSSKNVNSVVAKNDEHSGKAAFKSDATQAKTKSLEQDYDEYLNTDNEKEEDLIKAGVDEDSGMQSDVTNTDYGEDESTDIQETSAAFTTSTSSTTKSTSTTTSTTPRPVVTQHFDYRDPRAYDSSTGTQYNGYQPKNEYPAMSAHSVHKWQSLGTRESVKETRSNMQQYNKNGKNAEIKEAIQHAIKVSREGSCQWPRPRVIPVRDVYPSPSITYTPHCAILHRCSDDTGCCRSEALTCVPKYSHRVELSFYTTNVGGSSVVEKLSFYNHTECECKEKTEYERTDEKPLEQRFYRHYQPSSFQPQNMRRGPPKKPCRCPSEFTPRITPDGECQCNCYEYNQNCIKTRRGKGYFSLSDRLCIQNNQCATPNCEFGEYMKREGKCPRKRDKFDAIANFRTNLNHRYRS